MGGDDRSLAELKDDLRIGRLALAEHRAAVTRIDRKIASLQQERAEHQAGIIGYSVEVEQLTAVIQALEEGEETS